MNRRTLALSLVVIAAACLSAATLRAAELPTVEELEKKMAEAAAKVETFEADIVGEFKEPDAVSVRASKAHVVTETTRKDGKESVRAFQSCSTTGRGPRWKGLDIETKSVTIGPVFWLEERDLRTGLVKVTKRQFPGDANSSLTPAGMLSGMNGWGEHVKVEKRVLAEEPIDGRNMFVLQGSVNLGPTTMKYKYWVDEATYLVRREVSTEIHKRDPKAREQTTITTTDYLNVKVNEKIDPKVFEYTPPPGAVITDETKPKP